jgi:hypothetical protein
LRSLPAGAHPSGYRSTATRRGHPSWEYLRRGEDLPYSTRTDSTANSSSARPLRRFGDADDHALASADVPAGGLAAELLAGNKLGKRC